MIFLLVTEFIFSTFEPCRLVDFGEVDESTAKIVDLQISSLLAFPSRHLLLCIDLVFSIS